MSLLVMAIALTGLLNFTIRVMYPEHGMWLDRLCVETDIWRGREVSEKGNEIRSQRERLLVHYPALNNPIVWTVEGALYLWRYVFGAGPMEVDSNVLILVRRDPNQQVVRSA